MMLSCFAPAVQIERMMKRMKAETRGEMFRMFHQECFRGVLLCFHVCGC